MIHPIYDSLVPAELNGAYSLHCVRTVLFTEVRRWGMWILCYYNYLILKSDIIIIYIFNVIYLLDDM